MKQTLVFAAILIVAVAIYWPILRMAREDITKRSRAGLSNSILFAVLLVPLFGPILYLLFRRHFAVE